MKAHRILFGLLLTINAAAVAASEPEILVEGQRLTERQLQSEAQTFVTKMVVPTHHDQYSRWNAPVCPIVQGLSEAHAKIVTDKIRAVAAAAGAKVGRPDCDGNIVIVFTDDAKSVYRKFAARNGAMFAEQDVQPAEHKLLRDSALPVRWWFGKHLRDRFGHKSAQGSDVFPGPPQEFVGEYGSGSLLLYGGGSHIRTNVRVDQGSAAVLVDVGLAEGVRLDALSAYVAMVTLSAQRIPTPPLQVRSIANLFAQGREHETDLTDWDRAYLKALYSVPANMAQYAQRMAISRKMAGYLRDSE